MEWLDEEAPSVIVATDGSIRDDITAWAGAVWREGRRVFQWSTARVGQSSSFRAESEAFEDALVWLAANTQPEDKTILLTDSLSLVRKLQSGMVKDCWAKLIQQIKGTFSTVYIPGHSGIYYNSIADLLAGNARPTGDLIYSPADVISTMRTRLTDVEKEKQEKLWSTERLIERGEGYGTGSRSSVRGWRRKLVTQCATGVMTLNTLRTLLGEEGLCLGENQ